MRDPASQECSLVDGERDETTSMREATPSDFIVDAILRTHREK